MLHPLGFFVFSAPGEFLLVPRTPVASSRLKPQIAGGEITRGRLLNIAMCDCLYKIFPDSLDETRAGIAQSELNTSHVMW